MAYCHVAHDCIVGDHVIMSNATQLAGEVVVDNYAVIGGGTLIHQFCHIGPHVMIQGGALVNKDIPPYIKAAREPISYAGINSVGLRRRNFSNDVIREIQEIYRYLYLSSLNISDALDRIEAELPATRERDEDNTVRPQLQTWRDQRIYVNNSRGYRNRYPRLSTNTDVAEGLSLVSV